MMDTVEVIREEPEAAPVAEAVETPVTGLPQGSSSVDDRTLDDLLAEYDAKTRQAEPAASDNQLPQDGTSQDASGELDELLAQLSGPSPDQQRIEQLTGEIGSLRAQELERQSRADFDGFSKKLQSELGPNVDENFARTNLLAAYADRPELAVVWANRHVTDEQLRAADREFQELEALYHQAQCISNDDPRKAQAISWLERRGYQLGLLMNSRKILNDLWRDVQKRAAKVAPPIDELATADRDAVVFAVREASSGDLPAPRINFATMSDREFAEFTRKNYGF
jgi:hypothetical protein